MTEPSKRDRAADSLGRLFRRASRCVGPEPGDVEALVDLLIDAAAGRAEAAGPGGEGHRPSAASLGDEMIAGMEAYCDRLEAGTEDPGRCPSCGKPFEWFRPGKSRPTCECWGRDV